MILCRRICLNNIRTNLCVHYFLRNVHIRLLDAATLVRIVSMTTDSLEAYTCSASVIIFSISCFSPKVVSAHACTEERIPTTNASEAPLADDTEETVSTSIKFAIQMLIPNKNIQLLKLVRIHRYNGPSLTRLLIRDSNNAGECNADNP